MIAHMLKFLWIQKSLPQTILSLTVNLEYPMISCEHDISESRNASHKKLSKWVITNNFFYIYPLCFLNKINQIKIEAKNKNWWFGNFLSTNGLSQKLKLGRNVKFLIQSFLPNFSLLSKTHIKIRYCLISWIFQPEVVKLESSKTNHFFVFKIFWHQILFSLTFCTWIRI